MNEVITIDFDGTVTKDELYPFAGELADDCEEAIQLLYDLGYTLILNTCRTGEQLIYALKYLGEHNLLQYFSYINENDPEKIKTYGDDSRKISSDYNLDDKNLGGFPGWKYVMEYFTNINNHRKTFVVKKDVTFTGSTISSSTEVSGKYVDEVIKEISSKPSKKAISMNKTASNLVHTLRSKELSKDCDEI